MKYQNYKHLKRLFFFTIVIAVMLVTVGCSQRKSPDPLKVLAKAAASGKFLYGHQDDLVYGKAWNVGPDSLSVAEFPVNQSDIKSVCGEFPAIAGFDLAGIEIGDERNIDGVPFDLMRKTAETHVSRGGLVTFSWHPRNPFTGGDAWDVSSTEAVRSILEGGENHDKFMDWLSRAADFLESVKGNDGRPVPVIFRPFHENTASWFWWGADLCTPEQYKELYSLTHDYMVKTRGLENLVWAYSPNSGFDAGSIGSRYPGDEYVDIIGLDHYCFAPADTTIRLQDRLDLADEFYVNVLRASLEQLGTFAQEHSKLLALCETGFEGIPDPEWWTGTLLKGLEGIPVCYVLTWRNAWDKDSHYYAPFPGSRDEEDFKAFYDDARTVFLGK